jgi:hypothetical protein
MSATNGAKINNNGRTATLTAVCGMLGGALTALRTIGITGESNSECASHFLCISLASETFARLAETERTQDTRPNVVRLAPPVFVVRRGEDDAASYDRLADAQAHAARITAKGKCKAYVVVRQADGTEEPIGEQGAEEKRTAKEAVIVVTQPAIVQTAPAVKVPIEQVRQPDPIPAAPKGKASKPGNAGEERASITVESVRRGEEKLTAKGEALKKVNKVVQGLSGKEKHVALKRAAKEAGLALGKTAKSASLEDALLAHFEAQISSKTQTVSAPVKKETLVEQGTARLCACGNNYPVSGQEKCRPCLKREGMAKKTEEVTVAANAPARPEQGSAFPGTFESPAYQFKPGTQSWCGRCRKLPITGKSNLCAKCLADRNAQGAPVQEPQAPVIVQGAPQTAPVAPVVPQTAPVAPAPVADDMEALRAEAKELGIRGYALPKIKAETLRAKIIEARAKGAKKVQEPIVPAAPTAPAAPKNETKGKDKDGCQDVMCPHCGQAVQPKSAPPAAPKSESKGKGGKKEGALPKGLSLTLRALGTVVPGEWVTAADLDSPALGELQRAAGNLHLYVRPLEDKKLIERTTIERDNRNVTAYRLTEAGIEILATIV